MLYIKLLIPNMKLLIYIYIYIYIYIHCIYIVIVIVIFIWWSPLIPYRNLDDFVTYNQI